MQNSQSSQPSQLWQRSQYTQRTLVRLTGWTLGALGFLLSFALAMTVLVRNGNPGILLIWLAATIATLACMRAHTRWRKSFERMCSPEAVRTYYPARKGWRQDVEDIAFRDIPDASMSFSR